MKGREPDKDLGAVSKANRIDSLCNIQALLKERETLRALNDQLEIVLNGNDVQAKALAVQSMRRVQAEAIRTVSIDARMLNPEFQRTH